MGGHRACELSQAWGSASWPLASFQRTQSLHMPGRPIRFISHWSGPSATLAYLMSWSKLPAPNSLSALNSSVSLSRSEMSPARPSHLQTNLAPPSDQPSASFPNQPLMTLVALLCVPAHDLVLRQPDSPAAYPPTHGPHRFRPRLCPPELYDHQPLG